MYPISGLARFPMDGDKVRILEQKEKFDKGKQKFSKSIYTIDKKEGYK